MADTTPNNPFDFTVFSQDQVFAGKKVLEMFEKMKATASDMLGDEAVRHEFNRKKNIMLKEGVNLMHDEAKVKRKILDVDMLEKGVLNGMLEMAKNTLKHTKETYKYNEEVIDRRKELKVLEKQLEDMKKNEGTRNQDFEKHMARTIRDEQFSIKLQEMKGQAAINAHPLGPRMGKFLSSRTGMVLIQAGTMLANVFGKIFDGIMGVVRGVFNAITSVFTDSWALWNKISALTGNIAGDMGQTEFQTQQINNNIGQIGTNAARWGVSIEEALSFMTQFSEITGRNHIFLAEQVNDLSAVAKATGLGVQQAGEMYANMELIGYSTGQFRNYVEKTRQEAGMLGLNVTKVLTTVKNLLPAYYALNFKEGVEGLTKIVMKAQGLRFELNNMQNLANNVFNPEGAIELSAKLRVLGGSFARMADPFNLMLKGQTDAAGLMDDVINSLAGLAIKNKDGMFSIPPVQQALLREFASATGESVENLTRSTLQMAKQQDIIGRLQSRGMFNEKDLTAVANLAEFDPKTQEYMIKVDMIGTKKAISEINSNLDIAKQLHGFVREEQQVAETRMNLIEQFRNLYNTFLYSLQPLFRPIEALFKDSRFMMQLQNTFTNFGQMLATKLIPLLGSGGEIYEFFMNIGTKLASLLEGVGKMFEGNKSLIQIISEALAKILQGTWEILKPAIMQIGKAIGGSEVGSGIRTTAKVGGAIGGAMTGLQLGSIFGIPGALIGGGIGAILGLIGGSVLGNTVAPANDAIIRSDGSVQPFAKGDLAMLIDQKSITERKRPADMIPSKSMLSQVQQFPKEKYMPLNSYSGGSGSSQAGAPSQIVLSGTVTVVGDKHIANLTDADFKQMSIETIASLLNNGLGRYQNHQSAKKLQSEIITPIRST